MLWEVLTAKEKNEVLLKILVIVSKEDNVLDEKELAYLFQFCEQTDLNPELIRTFVMNDHEINEILPSAEEDRMRFMYHALFTMKADNIVDKSEEIMMYKLGFRLGLSEVMIREFINIMKASDMKNIPVESMLNVIRKHNN